jgi:glycosyltransferase involved in cell wall biosynthesis
MKIAVILGAFSIGSRPLDFHYNNIFESTRGATGTDIALCMLSKELRKLGHDIHIFTVHAEPHNKPDMWEGCHLYNFIDRHSLIDNSFDALVSLNEPDVFRGINSTALKVCYQFLNDFTYCQPNFDQYVDKWVGVCDAHVNYLSAQARCPTIGEWNVIPLGVDPNWYADQRVFGRVIWTSSADRGLHNLLEIWPKVKLAVPEASLKIFYHFEYGSLLNVEPNDLSEHHFHTVEMSHRLRYIVEAIGRMKHLDVEHCKSVSRNRIVKEMNEASVFAFPCDTVATTEGFSVSTMEAHASFTVPIITDQDCLGSVYKDSGAIMFTSPIRENLSAFADAIIKGLTDPTHASNVIEKCRQFSMQYTWANTAKMMEDLLMSERKK